MSAENSHRVPSQEVPMSLNSATHYGLRWPNTVASDPRVVAPEPDFLRFASDDPADAARWLLDV